MEPTPEKPRAAFPGMVCLAFLLLVYWVIPQFQERSHPNTILWLGISTLMTLFVVERNSHSMFWALCASIPFLFLVAPVPIEDMHETWLESESLLFAALLITALIWSELAHGKFRRIQWLFLLIISGWYFVAFFTMMSVTQKFGGDLQDPAIMPSLQRVQWASLAMMVGGTLLGASLAFRKRYRGVGFASVGLLILAPSVAFLVVRLTIPVDPAEYNFAADCWSDWWETERALELAQGWSWWSPALVGLLMVIGLWRTWGRGKRQRAAGLWPHSWLLAIFVLLSSSVFFSPRMPIGLGPAPFTMMVLAVWLPVFAVADMGWVIGERMVLEPGPVGPADTPRVKMRDE